MKKLVMIVLFSMVMLLGTVCMAEEEKTSILNNDRTKLTLKNDSENKKLFGVRWKNNPYGCHYYAGRIICDYTIGAGEMESNNDFTTNLFVGGKYCVDWDNNNYDKRTEETNKEYCFEVVDQNPIIITPEGIQDEIKVEVIKHPVTIKNCTIGAWVGMVKWIDDEKGEHINYQSMPEVELKEIGTEVVMLPEGLYAGTHYRPRQTFERDGITVHDAGAILEFQNLLIVDGPTTFEFGDCDALMINSL